MWGRAEVGEDPTGPLPLKVDAYCQTTALAFWGGLHLSFLCPPPISYYLPMEVFRGVYFNVRDVFLS